MLLKISIFSQLSVHASVYSLNHCILYPVAAGMEKRGHAQSGRRNQRASSFRKLKCALSGSTKKYDPGMSASIELIRKKVNTQPFSTTSVVNLPGKGFYVDIDGFAITQMQDDKITNGMSVVSEECAAPRCIPTYDLVSVATEMTCGQGYTIEVVYDITSVYKIVLADASGNTSYGKIRLLDSSGKAIWPTESIIPKYKVVSIENMGEAEFDNDAQLMSTIYRVTFKTDYLPESALAGAANIQPGLFTYTDCPTAAAGIGFSAQHTALVCPYSQSPCNRTDRVFFNEASAGYEPNIAGIANSLYCGAGYQFPRFHDVQFLNSQGTWVPFYLHGISITPGFTSTISSLDIAYIDVEKSKENFLAPGNVQVRYRNKMSNDCTSSWVYNTWYIQ